MQPTHRSLRFYYHCQSSIGIPYSRISSHSSFSTFFFSTEMIFQSLSAVTLLILTFGLQSVICGIEMINTVNEFDYALKARSGNNQCVVLLLCRTECDPCAKAELLFKRECNKNSDIQCIECVKYKFPDGGDFENRFHFKYVPYMAFFKAGKQVETIDEYNEAKITAGFNKLCKK